MRNRLLFAIPLTRILGALLLLHAYWALGGRWESAYTVPTINGRRSFDPSPLATWIVGRLLRLAVIIIIGKSGWIATGPLPVLFDVGFLAGGFDAGCRFFYLVRPVALEHYILRQSAAPLTF